MDRRRQCRLPGTADRDQYRGRAARRRSQRRRRGPGRRGIARPLLHAHHHHAHHAHHGHHAHHDRIERSQYEHHRPGHAQRPRGVRLEPLRTTRVHRLDGREPLVETDLLHRRLVLPVAAPVHRPGRPTADFGLHGQQLRDL
ncbi:hypothetical protein ACFFX0_10630 [Citricoccus parietis]|uniref:Uncharacterized protein n=1 Tax=Citricoccus parietis TaxID=592307 RepID=A0ABV5FY64_9MICC